jgi:tetratricopeptide (TPR) repeat protein
VATLRGLTERHPHVVDAWLAIGRCLQRLHRPGEAAVAMQRGLESSSRHPRLMYNLACYQSLAGHVTDALEALRKAIPLDPKYAAAALVDRDLDAIRSDPRFGLIVSQADAV